MLKNDIRKMTITSIFAAIIIMQSFIPMLGYIILPMISATIIPATVSLGSINVGIKRGIFLGLIMGICSMIRATITPDATAFIFSPFVTISGFSGSLKSVVVSILPRIFVGIIPYLVYNIFERHNKKYIGLIFAGLSAAITNTILVMGLIFILFRNETMSVMGAVFNNFISFIVALVGIQGIFEAVACAIISLIVGSVLIRISESTK